MQICMKSDANGHADFKVAVQERMAALDVSYAEIARRTGVHSSQVSRICRGQFETCSENVVQICTFLGVTTPRVGRPNIGIDGSAFNLGPLISSLSAEDIDRLIDVLRHVRDLASSSGQRLKRVRRVPR